MGSNNKYFQSRGLERGRVGDSSNQYGTHQLCSPGLPSYSSESRFPDKPEGCSG